MKGSACERWIELSDRMAVGEPLSIEEQRFEQQHRLSCADCAAEAQVWDALGRCLDDHSEPPRELDVAPSVAPSRRRWRWGVGAALVAAAAAAATALVVALPEHEEVAPGDTATSDARVTLVLVAGEVSVRGAQAAAGAELRPSDVIRVGRGRACLSHSKGTSTCANENTELRLVSSDRDRRLMLDSGAVVCRLDRQPPGVRFSVDTPRGRVTAKGTVFAVERLASSDVAVRVHRGVVEIEATDGTHRELSAPAGAIIGARAIEDTPTTGAQWHEDAQLIEAADLWAEGAVAPVDVQTRPPGAQITLDGVGLGESPVSTLVSRGDHELVVTQDGFGPFRERFVVQGAERVSRSPVLVAEPEASAAGSSSAAAAVPSAAELLARARSLRASGRFAEAGKSYQHLMTVHPRSAEARAALVSLGELQLSQLGSPAAALRSFEAYLAGGGSLTQEARYGRIRALRRLGRAAEARQASQEFVRDYPGSAQAKSLAQTAKQR